MCFKQKVVCGKIGNPAISTPPRCYYQHLTSVGEAVQYKHWLAIYLPVQKSNIPVSMKNQAVVNNLKTIFILNPQISVCNEML